MKKFAFALVCLCVSAFCFAAAKDGSIITYNLEYFANGAQKEIEFYITDSSVEINRFDKLVLNAKKAFGSGKLHEDLSDDFRVKCKLHLHYSQSLWLKSTQSGYIKSQAVTALCVQKSSSSSQRFRHYAGVRNKAWSSRHPEK